VAELAAIVKSQRLSTTPLGADLDDPGAEFEIPEAES
jgi:hypothetical protein